jgi:hypothetical protein
MKKIFGKSRGQVMVLYAGATVALVGVLALCADVAVMYVNWQQTQKVADAAALAGANYLSASGNTFIPATGTLPPGCTGDDAQKAACTYAVKNGLSASNLNPPISETASTITVSAQQTGLPYFFGQVLGLSTYAVAAKATAQVAQPPGTTPIFPIGFNCPGTPTQCANGTDSIAGAPLTFGSKFVGGIDPGNWQWLDTSGGNGGGISLLEQAILGTAAAAPVTAENADGTCPSGNCKIATQPGNAAANNNQVQKDFASRFNSTTCPTTPDPCTQPPGKVVPGDQCLVAMPVVNFAQCAANVCAVEGFVQVYIEPGSTTAQINGCYMNTIAAGAIGSSSVANFGPKAPPVLIQ